MKINFPKSVLAIFAVFLMACGSNKTPATEAELDRLAAIVKNKDFKIVSDWAYPTTTMAMQQAARLLPPGNQGGSVNLIGNSNFLTISGDSITSYLPYFGERQMGGSYGGDDSVIAFKGLMKNYNVTQKKDSSYDISFEAQSKSENFQVNITLFPNLKSEMILRGNKRTAIRYSSLVQNKTASD
ncbi:DUF4251 domain-containing protein [Pseudotamlana carrageenivorans]|uniref:DUF4251 domain-containing protein n=1 Tax=Pseudotamlana carrageenivorans TaxID=2069432 RepID=A0A2I7SLL2_9FLAO|nr:DUF4251 domain-containing protein [Tamlana carrageenivorans]AUS06747.1 hypothetical protein C1A40_15420 [Tamlana carrageenivorans]